MLKNQPRVLTTEESAFAAKHFTLVYTFLAENNLSEEDYYDCAINGFLRAVQEYPISAGCSDFKHFAKALMEKECSAYEESLETSPIILSLSECCKNSHELEETIADVKSTLENAISAIAYDETMQSFNATQQRIVKLLMAGYSKIDIASMLHMNISALIDEISFIQEKTSSSPLMMAA